MFLVNEFILPPTEGGLVLLKALGIFLFLLHLPFIFMLIGGSTLSVLFQFLNHERPDAKFHRFSREIMEKASIHKGAGVMLGVVPLLSITMIFQQLLYGNKILCVLDWWLPLVLQIAGLLFLYAYSALFSRPNTPFFQHIGLGGTGTGLLVLAYFIFIANKSYLLYPETWEVERHPVLLSFASNILPSFLWFMAMAFSVTGTGILVFFRSSCVQDKENPGYGKLARTVGLALLFLCTLAQPAIAILDLIVLPESAVGQNVIMLYYLSVIVGMFLCLSIFFAFFYPHRVWDKGIVFFVLLALCVFIAYDYNTRKNSLSEQLLFLQTHAATLAPQFNEVVKVDDLKASAGDLGKKVYEKNCNSCHSIDGSPNLGPTFKGLYGSKKIVITSGQEQEVEANDVYIKNSILNPAQDIAKGYKNLMPNQNLKQKQIDQIVEFLKTIK